MSLARKVVEMGLNLRKEAGIRVRQPLLELAVQGSTFGVEFREIIADELNVKEVTEEVRTSETWVTREDAGFKVALNTEMTDELKKEGLVRELVRAINGMRKELGLTPEDEVTVEYSTEDQLLQSVFAEYDDELKKQVLARALISGGDVEVDIAGAKVMLSLKK